MKLFKVRVVTYLVVLADDAEEAHEIADSFELMDSDMSFTLDVEGEVKAEADLPPGWRAEHQPYSFDPDMDIGRILGIKPDTKTIDMFAAVQS